MQQLRVMTIVGARPQFIKAAPVSRELRKRHSEILVHTGQHYDDNMSTVFFQELDIPVPDYNLGVGSGPHGEQTGEMLKRIEEVLLKEEPDWVLVYGDTNSTLAGAMAAAKLNIRIAHVEAGLRSFNRKMPEEINRVITDHLSTLLLCPSGTAVDNLNAEGIVSNVHLVGDVMADALAFAARRAKTCSGVLRRLGLAEHGYIVATVHRAENTDDSSRLLSILEAFAIIDEPVILPIHPRTRKRIMELGRDLPQFANGNLRFIEPLGYLDMVRLMQSARMILTDSGGLQKEAYWLGVPCVTLRDETEWIETVEMKWNVLAGADRDSIVNAVRSFVAPSTRGLLYGDGQTAQKCVNLLGVLAD